MNDTKKSALQITYPLLLLANLPSLCLAGFMAFAALTISTGLSWIDLIIRPLLILIFILLAVGLAHARSHKVDGDLRYACRFLSIQFAVTTTAYTAFYFYVGRT